MSPGSALRRGNTRKEGVAHGASSRPHDHEAHAHEENSHEEQSREGRSHQGHSHGVDEGSGNVRSLTVVLVLTTTFLVAEIVGGLLTGSLALLADAGHMASDSAAWS